MCPVLLLDVSTRTRCKDLPPFAFLEVPESQEDILIVHSVVRGVVILGAADSLMCNTPVLLYYEVFSIHVSFFNNSCDL